MLKMVAMNNYKTKTTWLRLSITISLFGCWFGQGEALAQREGSNKPASSNSVVWTRQEAENVQIEKSGQIQTYRIQRVNRNGTNRSINQYEFRVDTSADPKLQIEAIGHPIATPGANQIEIFSKALPHQEGVFGGQIVVEMKKVKQDKKARAVGFFAPNSWVESKNGRVELFADQWQFSSSPETKRYWIGVRCQETKNSTPSSASSNRITLVVDDVVKNSAADRAGVKVKDTIVRWNRKALSTVDSLVDAIQSNEDKPANLGIVRGVKSMELTIKPQARQSDVAKIQTVIVPAAELNVAEKKIEQLRKMVAVTGDGENRQFRVLLVGPGVNFGDNEIELHVNPEVKSTKARLKQLIDRVAEKKFGMVIEEDSVTLKKAYKADGELDGVEFQANLDFEPHEIWQTMQFGVNDKKFSFGQLAPRMIHRARADVVVAQGTLATQAHNVAKSLKAGQIVFPNPVTILRQEKLKAEIELLKLENQRMRNLNTELKEALQNLRDDLKKKLSKKKDDDQ